MATLLEHDTRLRPATGLAGFCVRVIRWTALTAWTLTRLSLLAVLIAIEPLIALLLSAATILLLGMALFLEYGYTPTPPSFRFVTMLLCGFSCALALLGYYALLRFLIRR